MNSMSKARRYHGFSVVIGCGLILIVLFQNCAQSGFEAMSSSHSSTSSPGNGPVVPLPGSGPLTQPVLVGGTVTDMKIENTSSGLLKDVPVTFGQAFAIGQLSSNDQVAGKLSDGSVLPLQMDVKARHADGSLRHAVISAVIPKLAAGETETLSLIKATGSTQTSALIPNDLVAAGFVARVNVNLGGVLYTASVDELLKTGPVKHWLSGPITNEWLVWAPLKTSAGAAHPHLTARFAIRAYAGMSKAKVDVIIENNWAYEPGPQNFTYDVQIVVGGQTVYSKTALNHFHHARWRKTFWWGEEPQVHLKHNIAYLIATKALPNYDLSIPVAEAAISSLKADFSGAKTEPMGHGVAQPYMGTAGGRPDIGLNPAWGVLYLMSMDKRAKDVALGMGDLGGTWPAHYRDKKTDRPLSIIDYPYSGTLGNPGDKINPVTKMSEDFPACGGTCTTPNAPDTSHLPNFAYIPYLVTGEHFYLEELQFWSMFTVLAHNPHYRLFEKGVVKADQLRGQGWNIRLLGEAAYITPDNDALKQQFNTFLDNNLEWYNNEYTNNPNANKLGIIVNGYSISYNNSRGIAPWMDDFFTQSVGHAAELGFSKAKPLLLWKSKFQIGRMTAPGYCWIFGAIYALNVRETSTTPFYNTLGEAYEASKPPEITNQACGSAEMAAALKLTTGEMTGFSPYGTGYPSNYQPALAYSVDSGAPGAAEAWKKFMSRSVKPDYQNAPQFSIVPR